MLYEIEIGIGHLTETEGYTETAEAHSDIELQNIVNTFVNEIISRQNNEKEFSIKINLK